MAVRKCNVVVTQTLSYPTQLATHRHPPPSAQNSDTCVHCRASIFGDLRPQKIDVVSTGISSIIPSMQGTVSGPSNTGSGAGGRD